MAEPMQGEVLGHYRIAEALGQGAMGHVYRAEDQILGRDVALKLLPEDVASDEDHLERFQREARALAALNHPNIVMVFSVEEDAGTHFMTMELVDGASLDRHIPEGGLDIEAFLGIAIAMADALAEAHDRGVVHRDLKPANTLVDNRGRVKIADFGLAKIAKDTAEGANSEDTTIGLTSEGRVVGTVPYMSPEQVEGRSIDRRSDIFSFGSVLYEMATARRPFTADSRFGVMMAIASDTPPPPSSWRASIPRRLDVIVRRCLEKKRSARYQTAHELKRDLETLRDVLESGTTVTRVESPKVPARASGVVGSLTGGPSIAVLPFTNLTAEPDDDYFGDGLAEELINALSKISGLSVPARSSSFRFRGADRDIRQIARQLRVATVLEGSIRRSGNRVRIGAQLISAADGYHLWSDSYDCQLGDIFSIQDEVARAIVQQLKVELHRDSDSGPVRRYTENHEAYQRYLKGRFYWVRRDQTSMQKALEFFEAALGIDPDYALARVGLADVYSTLATYVLAPPRPALARARAEVTKALEIDANLAEAHASRATIDMLEARWEESDAGFQHSIDLKPGNGFAHIYYALMLAVHLRIEEMNEQIRLAVRAEPLSHFVFGLAALANFLAQRYEQAISFAESGLELEPGSLISLWSLGLCQSALGDHDAAIENLTLAMDVSAGSPSMTGMLAYGHAVAGNAERAKEIVALAESRLDERMRSYYFFGIPLALGDRKRAHEMLERGMEEGIPPQWICFYHRPFPDLLERVGLPAD